LNDPVWCNNLIFGDDYSPTEPVVQFNQTPLMHEILKWSRHMMLKRTNASDVCVGDFVRISGDQWANHIAQVSKFLHKPGTINRDDASSVHWWPTDFCEVKSFRIIANQEVIHEAKSMFHIPFDCVLDVVPVSSGTALLPGDTLFCHRTLAQCLRIASKDQSFNTRPS